MTDQLKDLEGHNKVPRGWLIFFFALIAWGVFYIIRYTPEISGWSYYDIYREQAAREKEKEQPFMKENPYEFDEKSIVEGKTLYGDHCAECHGKDLKGDIGPDLTNHLAYGETDEKKFESIAEGRPDGMPAFNSLLGRDKIWKVLAYIDSVREYGRKP